MRPSWLSRIFALFLLAILAFYVLWLTMDNTGTFYSATDLADLDGDGDLDIFAAVIAPGEGRNRDPSDRVILNDGAGNFSDSGQRLGKQIVRP